MTERSVMERRSAPSVQVLASAEEVALAAAEQVQRQLKRRSDSVLALPTGQTPIGLYAELSRRCRDGELSFADVRTFNLDEFVHIPPDSPLSFESYMMQHLFSHIDVDLAKVRLPNGNAPNLDAECRDYEREIAAAGGIDLAIVGIGLNGHLAFNEPGTPFESRTHVVRLSPSSREAFAAEFGGIDRVPELGITMGLGTVGEARRIILLALGQDKAEIVARALEGPVTVDVPASILQQHPNVQVILDRGAAHRLHVMS
ncbi:MAG: glucosamine-6-phosphate deaminase [Chloroflexi bacterium]|nr:glucosamine-6-phosphate deaminase [Chloroflexota bacterium]